MTEQLFFDLQTGSKIHDFLESGNNKDAIFMVDRWPDWDGLGVIIYGPSSSGKTHLLSLWAERSKAIKFSSKNLSLDSILQYKDVDNLSVAIDDIDELAKDLDSSKILFHLYNLLKEQKGSILLTATKPIAAWDCPLPDLASRLKTLPSVFIEPPDEQMLQHLLVKFFSDRQLRISSDVVSYIINRTERSFIAIETLLQMLDKESLSQKRAITVPFVRDIIDNMQKTVDIFD